MMGGRVSLAPAGCGGQMTVELAVVAPVVVAVALIVFNLMGFIESCAAFDQAAMDAVIAQGVAPTGDQGRLRAVEQVRAALERSMEGRSRCEVDVRAEDVSGDEDSESTLVISPLLTRFVCTMTYHPWPLALRMPGVRYGAPLVLTHERELVVDRYRPGVVV